MAKEENHADALAASLIKGLQDKKGVNIVSLDLGNIENAVARYFIICHGTSRTHVDSLAEGAMENALKDGDARPWHKEGMENAEWILIDYADVVIHIFQEETRSFYKLESLWEDAGRQDH